eukprot:TRINITY_DN9742_c0_g1_i1.p1 TRINITY_DN9742_c0_g1~~TRINITY_DN9742_c0_g1_i1.p1  ORF type:complete len:196 (-),score=41.34 TRINITY_DN9742_c0_g1_i1:38-625(-)
MSRCYVGNLSYQTNWQDLKDYMKSVAEVKYAEILTDQSGRSKGCGIVEFETFEGAQRAITELNDTHLDGRLIFVREDRENGQRGGFQAHHGGFHQGGHHGNHGGNPGGYRFTPEPGTKIYVGNLPYEMRWQDLKDLFSEMGPVRFADILMYHDGRSKGSGVVTFENPQDAQHAINECNGKYVGGRQINVRYYQEA